jgi:hypothetical protein
MKRIQVIIVLIFLLAMTFCKSANGGGKEQLLNLIDNIHNETNDLAFLFKMQEFFLKFQNTLDSISKLSTDSIKIHSIQEKLVTDLKQTGRLQQNEDKYFELIKSPFKSNILETEVDGFYTDGSEFVSIGEKRSFLSKVNGDTLITKYENTEFYEISKISWLDKFSYQLNLLETNIPALMALKDSNPVYLIRLLEKHENVMWLEINNNGMRYLMKIKKIK